MSNATTVSAPFYSANRQHVVGDSRLWDLSYFRTLAEAEACVAEGRARGYGGYVLETTEGQIWRATVRHAGLAPDADCVGPWRGR